jgi:hypothetical protein
VPLLRKRVTRESFLPSLLRTVTTSGNLGDMAKTSTPTEIWFTTTKTGKRRAWYYGSYPAMRAFAYPLADAELAIATGAAREVSRPDFVGGRR